MKQENQSENEIELLLTQQVEEILFKDALQYEIPIHTIARKVIAWYRDDIAHRYQFIINRLLDDIDSIQGFISLDDHGNRINYIDKVLKVELSKDKMNLIVYYREMSPEIIAGIKKHEEELKNTKPKGYFKIMFGKFGEETKCT